MVKKSAKRRAKADLDRRTKAYTVRYNDAENDVVAAAAAESSLEVASWIRMVSVRAAKAEVSVNRE